MRIHRLWLIAWLLGIWVLNAREKMLAAEWEDPLRGIPLMSSFDVPPTRHNGEVWAFAPADAGQIWIGSDELFRFDGESRQKIALPFDNYAVRAFAEDRSGKLWVGAIGEIGYLEPTTTGGWRYVSARNELRLAGIAEVRVWDAMQTAQGVAFVTDDAVLRWNGTRFERWPLPSTSRLHPTHDRDNLWIFQPGKGLLRMEASGPRLVLASSDLPDEAVSWALGSTSTGNTQIDGPLLLGDGDNVYRRENNRWVKLHQLTAAVIGKSAWRAIALDDKTVAIGTIQGGVVIGTVDDRVLAVIDRSSGLPNESVTSLWLDERSDLLWIGYVGGMSCVDARGVASVFDSRNGFNDAPALKAIFHGERTYILTRHSVSLLSPQMDERPAAARLFARISTPLSDALSHGPNLWLSSFGGGLWRVTGDKVKQELNSTGYIYRLSGSRSPPTELFYLEDTTVRTLVAKPSGGWEAGSVGPDMGATAISGVADIAGDLWVSTVTRGVIRFRVENGPGGSRVFQRQRYDAGHGMPSGNLTRPILTTLGDRVFLLSEQGILGYNPKRDRFESMPGLERFVALAGAPSSDPSIAYWVVRNGYIDPALPDSPALIRLHIADADAPPTWEPIDVASIDQAGRISSVSFTGGASPSLWIGGSQKLLRLSEKGLNPPATLPSLELQGVSRNGIPLNLPGKDASMQLDSNTTRVRIELGGVKRADSHALFVQSSLLGLSSEWSKPQPEPIFEFAGLRAGSYHFRARIVDRFGRIGPEFSLAFALAPPWYWSTPTILGYVAVGLIVIWLGVRLRLRRLHRLNERLNTLVDTRTAELARANIARNEFLEAISHEIRNPLNGVTNLVDLLRDTKLDPEAHKLAESLGRSAAHLKQVFGDVLGYTRLEYGHVELELTTFSLRGLLEDTVALFSVQAREQRSQLSLNLTLDHADGFRGDAGKIQTVVSNYVSNALKYAPGDLVEIIARLAVPSTDENTSLVWIGVQDNGPGLSLDEQQNLFRKFSRGHAAKTRGISGTGLGLAICRNVADLLDGKVGVTSTEGHGATFWLEIPLVRAPMPTPPLAPILRSSSPQALAEIALIVDDQEYNRVVLRGIAKRLGYQAELAASADDVWPLLDRFRFGVVFLDWELPGLTGGEIARRLREYPQTHDAVIIATTAHDNEEIVQKCLDAGMDAFAAKPFDTAQIGAILADAVSRRSDRKSAFSTPSNLQKNRITSELSLTAFADFAAGDPSRAQEAVTLYLRTLEEEIAVLRDAMTIPDREAVARCAHRLRSHAGLVNGTRLNIAAQNLAAAARSASSDAWSDLVDNVYKEADSLKSAILRLAKEVSAGQLPG